ncbi:MAG: hypothetical protein R3A51_16615 [Nannocystaceae bacterium]|nr:hypothetical protein [Myxococcales bacterium]
MSTPTRRALAIAAVAVVVISVGLWLALTRGRALQADGRCFADCVLAASPAEAPVPEDLRERCARACQVDAARVRARALEEASDGRR